MIRVSVMYPTGEGKKQSPRSGAPNKLRKRADVLQAAGFRQNIGTVEEEEAGRRGFEAAATYVRDETVPGGDTGCHEGRHLGKVRWRMGGVKQTLVVSRGRS